MKIIGITGLIAGGKTEAAHVMARMGAYIIDADKEAHNVLLKSGAAYGGIAEAFGDEILGADGEIDRKKLGNIVFGNAQKLEMLNSLTHKHVIREIERQIKTIKNNPGDYTGIVLDVVYLYESGLYKLCDQWIIVAADEEKRLERIIKRNQLTPEAAMNRIRSQNKLNAPEKLRYADYVLENNDDLTAFIQKTEELAQHVFKNN
ncbi:MAG: dephospho-CoA kinase [Defluviitaleaceae bacterium]|nr:dephospho-CoA kinase [Defluviitaleaceae bacterium]MCL2837182.1 dephospho-CoA kinase [Defluviitaleaceae bacterium]